MSTERQAMASMDTDSAGMRPMRIVSGSEVEQSCLPQRCRHRGLVFLAGVGLTLAAVLGVVFTQKPKDKPPSLWTVRISLQPDELYMYNITDDSTSNATVTTPALPHPINMRNDEGGRATYQIDKMCGNDDWAYMRFLVLHVPQVRGNDTEDHFVQVLKTAVQGHTFTAKLKHDGGVLREDKYNLESSVRNAMHNYMANDPLAGGEEGRKQNVARAEEIVENVLQDAYPALQSSPPQSEPVHVGSKWTRLLPQGSYFPESVNETLEFQEFRDRKLPTGQCEQPVVLTPQSVSEAGKGGPCTSPRDTEFLVLKASVDYATHDTRVFENLLRSLPGGPMTHMTIVSAKASLKKIGHKVVGSKTGVVLESRASFAMSFNMTMEVDTHVPTNAALSGLAEPVGLRQALLEQFPRFRPHELSISVQRVQVPGSRSSPVPAASAPGAQRVSVTMRGQATRHTKGAVVMDPSGAL